MCHVVLSHGRHVPGNAKGVCKSFYVAIEDLYVAQCNEI